MATLRHALEGLGTLSTQRAGLEEALKERRNTDYILPRLLSGSADNPEGLFKQEIAKYDDLVKEIDENLSKQSQLLELIGTNEKSFKQAYNFSSWRKACEVCAHCFVTWFNTLVRPATQTYDLECVYTYRGIPH